MNPKTPTGLKYQKEREMDEAILKMIIEKFKPRPEEK